MLRTAKGEAEGITSGLLAVIGEAHDLHIPSEGAVKALGAIGAISDFKGLLTHPFAEAEASAITARGRCLPPREVEEAPDLVAPIGDIRPITSATPLASTDEGAVDKIFSLLSLPCKEKLTDGGQMLDSFGIPSGRIHRSAPHRALIERDLLGLDTAIGEHP